MGRNLELNALKLDRAFLTTKPEAGLLFPCEQRSLSGEVFCGWECWK